MAIHSVSSPFALNGPHGEAHFPSERKSGTVFRSSRSDCLENPARKLANKEGKIDFSFETSDKDEIAVEKSVR